MLTLFFSFAGQADNFLVFASETKKMLIARKSMTVLGGDSHFNKWVCPLIPLANLPKVDVATHAAIFADQEDAIMEDTEDFESGVPDGIIAKDQRVPFPQDWVAIMCCFLFQSYLSLFFLLSMFFVIPVLCPFVLF